MSRQISFFFSPKDEELFIKYLRENDIVFLDKRANEFDKEHLLSSDELSFYLTFSGANIEKSDEFVEQISSEIIKYSRCKTSKRSIEPGRLWLKLKYWNSENELVEKNQEINHIYSKLVKWIKKNSKISICKYYYIGTNAFNLYSQHNAKMETGPGVFIEFV
jgi:hypothetical protein